MKIFTDEELKIIAQGLVEKAYRAYEMENKMTKKLYTKLTPRR